MKMWKTSILFMVVAMLPGRAALAAELMVAAGAGYKRPLVKVYQAFEEHAGITVDAIFGNMRQILTQVERSGRVAVAVGDRHFLAGAEQLEGFTPLGNGRLVIIHNKVPIGRYEDLLGKKVIYVAMPDPQKAIYGKAAAQMLQRTGLQGKLEDKLIVTATIPQVSSFVIAGSAEAGFVNLTDAMAIRESIGGWTVVPEDLYDPIVIGFAVTRGFADRPEVAAFKTFMAGPIARKILSEFGL